ncbi:Histidinol dehydrogenase [Thermosinus carboxydivorans Nor1]|uniref:Histidinol dehydrogenase n=1 Tax=Thermosinus carboxydivorans Nor1 TaxID=401526 RepID=A1HMG9_9FIRM|nr:histidinol dehydrogenase [Thermosinus carboxydivorans]EAX49009.1 Histidinol dehydrogenase [Thermosinus carboxydivorans Nor1]
MKIVVSTDLTAQELVNLFHKPAFDEVELSDNVRQRVREVFGRDMTASEVVAQIVGDVRREGDDALLRYTRAIDGAELSPATLAVSEAEFAAAVGMVDCAAVAAIRRAIANVRRFHAEQLPKSWFTEREQGAILGQKCIPLDRVGIYVPGGTAAYPSSVIMNAVPAAVAGVKEIIMTVPPHRDGSINPYVLVAAREAGVTQVFKVGGAQAIAAMAFGTATIPKVDKIVGPGNLFVTLAKKAVYGHCDIDMLAGPSEILIIADSTADPRYIAADLLSQAEHDPLASSILITDSTALARQVAAEIEVQLAALPRREIAAAALRRAGLIIIARDLFEAVELANMSAPEHLEIVTADPFSLLPYVRHAGAVFLGPYSPEPLGDYLAGPNHVLPTGGTARFYSVLNVETFMKKTSIIAYTKAALAAVSDDIIRLATVEGLQAHANAVRLRKE